MHEDSLELRQVVSGDQVDARLRQALTDCWVDVTNAGGAAGFPFPPIDAEQAASALDAVVAGLAPETCRLIVALLDGEAVGWLVIRRDVFRLVSHWGTLHHVQTHPGVRGRGIGGALLERARQVARDDMGLEHLRLAARGGVGLEDFYGRLGWKETGRWPGALRFAPGDDRDEILMVLQPL
ncbi:GNAT family N-acetyltransferase [Streptomyces sp. NPDC049555]|uniref:GNAT family N-acetyltransferase n=1 Tax=unclassified Streptomyces TaxID=2593676 RepID=UPI00341A4AD8